jgi:methyltransferase (TIGR00027 family)
MEEGQASSTAIIAAMSRAEHLLWDDPPKIFEDTFASALAGCANEAALRERLDIFLAKLAANAGPNLARSIARGMRSIVTMRSRYVEDELAKAIGRGVAQYVILGAGLDSFAYRRPDLANVLRVFEVDYPATQAWKRTRLQELSAAVPPNLVFVPLDFQKQSLIEALRTSSYRIEAAGFFAWLGVTMFLTPGAIFDTLRMVASMAVGTEIVFDYYLPAALLDGEVRQIHELVTNWAAAQGEPWLSLFQPENLAEQVRELGFSEVRDFGPEEANARYCANRTDGLRLPGTPHFMSARVGPRSN